MKDFLGVFRYEYRMSIRRWSLWLAFGLLMVLYLTSMLLPARYGWGQLPAEHEILSFVATIAFMLNLFMPVVGGILVADRLVRDQKLGVDELLRSTVAEARDVPGRQILRRAVLDPHPGAAVQLLMGVSPGGRRRRAADRSPGDAAGLPGHQPAGVCLYHRLFAGLPAGDARCGCTRCCSPATGSGAISSVRRSCPPSTAPTSRPTACSCRTHSLAGSIGGGGPEHVHRLPAD